MLSKEKAMREEAREAIIEALENDYTGYYCDLHSEVFNYGYIGTAQEEVLKEFGVFEAAIEKVQAYEKDNFGEIYTDLSDPEAVVNMLYYIIREEVLLEIMDGVEAWEENWDNLADEETNAKILQAIKEKIQQG